MRYSFLDSSRGLAALCVLLSHFIYFYGLYPGLSYTTGPFAHVLDGSSAVTYFFVLSAFVLSTAFFNGEKQIDSINFKKYFVQRLFRIFPLFIACLFISYLCLSYFSGKPSVNTIPSILPYGQTLWKIEKSAVDALKEALLIIRLPAQSKLRMLPQDWTLTKEIIMSLFVPVMVFILKRSSVWFFIFTILIYNYDIYILPFAIGILIAKHHKKLVEFYAKSPVYTKLFLAIFALFLFTNLFGLFDAQLEGKKALPLLIKSLGAALLLGLILASTISQLILKNRILSYLGKISYGIYLTHFFILIVGVPFFLKFLNSWGINSELPVRLLSLLFLFATTVVISHVLHKLVERPFISAGKKLTQYLTEPKIVYSFRSIKYRKFPAFAKIERTLFAFALRK